MTTTPRYAKFSASLSNGGTATWTAEVVRVENGIAYVRHPKRARALPFSPVQKPGLYRYDASKLTIVEPTSLAVSKGN